MGDHPSDRLTSPPSPGRVVSFALDASESSPNKVTVGEEDGVWDDFLEAYSQGQWNPPPPLPSPAPTISQIDSGPRWFGTIPSSLGSARAALGVYQEKGYFPPIPGPHEEERLRVVQRFGLDKFERRPAIDTIAELAQARFGCSVVVVSVVLEDRDIFVSSIGWDEREKEDDFPRLEIPLETALCAHAMTKPEGSPCFLLEDAREDWRFANNPYVGDGGPIAFFASANVNLPTSTSESSSAKPKRLPVGSLCIIDREPRDRGSFSAQDALVLKGLAELVGREIQLAFEEKRESAAARQTAWLGEFLRKSLVQPGLPPVPPSSPSPTPSSTTSSPPPLELSHAAESLRDLLNADTSVILDLRSFNAPFAPSDLASVLDSRVGANEASLLQPPNSDNASGILNSRPGLRRQFTTGSGSRSGEQYSYSSDASRWGTKLSGLAVGAGKVSVLGTGGGYDWEDAVKRPGTRAAISHSLVAFYSDGVCEFDSGTIPSPLSDLLPPQTTASLSVQIFDWDGKPVLLLILCSYTPHFRFDATDRQYLENVGAVAIGSLLRRRVLEADQAKLAFVSQVSHELRTPLHGIGSQLELIRTLSSPLALKVIDPLLEMAEVCTTSLREILDDTLAFAKITNADPAPAPASRDLLEVELEQLAEDVLKSCWARKHQRSALEESKKEGENDQVDLVLEMDRRLDGCRAKVDVGGLKRLLFNLIGNALKFTERGNVTVSVGLTSKPRIDTVQMVTIKVADTGIGMSDEFIVNQLFVPFKQQDPFSPGAGLGLSICSTIVKRMGGTLHFESSLGAGTIAAVCLPLELVRSTFPSRGTPSTASSSHASRRIRIISEELKLLLDPAQLAAKDVETPPPELAPPSPPSEAPPAIPSPPNPPSATSLAPTSYEKIPLRVLVVDDNAIGRKILATFLRAKHVDFEEAENGLEAVEIFKSYRPNLVWCDVQMPVMDGIESTAQMRDFEVEHDLPPSHIVAISGLSNDTKTHLAVVESGQINEWLVKGGPTLKLLGEGLAQRQQELDELNSRLQAAASLEAAAAKLRNGGALDERLRKALLLVAELEQSGE